MFRCIAGLTAEGKKQSVSDRRHVDEREGGSWVFVCVYRGSGPLDAYLVSHWLERLGIVVQVRGGDLASVRGEIPIMDAWPTLWVPKDQAVAAADGIQAFEAEAALATAWTCPACDEGNEPSFGSCWSCQADRPTGR